jgi:hypothetical protein
MLVDVVDWIRIALTAYFKVLAGDINSRCEWNDGIWAQNNGSSAPPSLKSLAQCGLVADAARRARKEGTEQEASLFLLFTFGCGRHRIRNSRLAAASIDACHSQPKGNHEPCWIFHFG